MSNIFDILLTVHTSAIKWNLNTLPVIYTKKCIGKFYFQKWTAVCFSNLKTNRIYALKRNLNVSAAAIWCFLQYLQTLYKAKLKPEGYKKRDLQTFAAADWRIKTVWVSSDNARRVLYSPHSKTAACLLTQACLFTKKSGSKAGVAFAFIRKRIKRSFPQQGS